MPTSKPLLSVIIITKNETHNIRQCLESVKWADEIIVFDSGSEDNTLAICREYTDKIYETDWPGFGPQKNRALQKAAGDWVFSIDADEWVSESLRQAICSAIANSNAIAYQMPRRNSYCGHIIRYGDVGKDIVTRLFRRGYGEFSNDLVHERVIINGDIKTLLEPLHHNSYHSLEDLLERMNTYTTLSATMRHKKGKKSSLSKAIAHSFWAFIKAYFLRLGFLDGRIGFIVAVSSAESSYYRYAKLMLLNQKK